MAAKTKTKASTPRPAEPKKASVGTAKASVGLTDKQRVFVDEYLVDLNGTQAAIRAGYSKDTAYAIAYENLRKPQIGAAIDKALSERGGITRTRIVDELAKIAFSDIRKVVSWGPEITEVEVKGEDGKKVQVLRSRVLVNKSEELDPDIAVAVSEVSQSERGIRVKMHDKPAALEKLGRALKMFTERVELTNPDGQPVAPTIILTGRPSRPEPPPAPKAVGGVRKRGH